MKQSTTIIVCCLGVLVGAPLLTAQPSSDHSAILRGDRDLSRTQIAEVVTQDNFQQVILVRRDNDGGLETIPFAKWTVFSRFLDGRSWKQRPIEPTDVRRGDRVWIQFDPNESVAVRIVVYTRKTCKSPAS